MITDSSETPAGRALALVEPTTPVAPVIPPAARQKWLKRTKEAHAAFWADEVAPRLVTAASVGTVTRYFDLFDDRERSYRDLRQERYSTGSTGQTKMAPAAAHLIALEGLLLKFETELGISPAARSRMKLEAASTEVSLDKLLRSARGDDPEVTA